MADQITYKSNHQPVHQIVNLYKSKKLRLDPPFQRSGVWKPKQRIHLLQSIFQGYPIPSIFLYRHVEDSTGNTVFEVIDGKQRIESILMYMGLKTGCFSAPVQFEGDEIATDRNWTQLRKLKKQSLLEEFQLQIIEVEGGFSEIIELFVRINSTGNALTPQEIRNARFYTSEFLKESKRLATKYENYFRDIGLFGQQQLLRMKHIEFMSELLYASSIGKVGNKKRVLDTAMSSRDGLKGVKLQKASKHAVSSLNRLKSMFPDLSPSIRFHKASDFYSLAVLIQSFEARGFVLTDAKSNLLAWDILTKFSGRVDILARQSKNLEHKQLSASDELVRQYLFAVRADSDSESSRETRHNILKGLLESLYDKKDSKRLFSEEQRRILWNTADQRVCAQCGCNLGWEDFHADHIKPHSAGGKTTLENAAILCAAHNKAKGKKLPRTT